MERRLRVRAQQTVDAEREEAISCPAGVGVMMLCRGRHEAVRRHPGPGDHCPRASHAHLSRDKREETRERGEERGGGP